MTSTVTIINVLVASPGDVAEERLALEAVVNEVNRNVGANAGFRIELIKWENLKPGFGEYPQDVINKQVDDDYDVLIGILWSRIGTKTPVAESGTVEEIERAYERLEKDPTSVELLLYFKTDAVPMEMIDPEQIARLMAFKKTVGEKGGIYKPFSTLSDFESTLRADLSVVINDFKGKHLSAPASYAPSTASETHSLMAEPGADNSPSSPMDQAIEELEEVDYGIFDYLDISNTKFNEMGEAMQEITDAMGKLGKNVEERTEKLKQVVDDPNLPERTKLERIKQNFLYVAEILFDFARTVDSNSEHLLSSRNQAFDALSKYLVLMAETFPDQTDALDSQEESLRGLIETKQETYQSILGMREMIERLPKFIGSFNKSRRHSVTSLNRLMREFDATEESAQNLIETITSLKAGA
jgi:hypothetical protein